MRPSNLDRLPIAARLAFAAATAAFIVLPASTPGSADAQEHLGSPELTEWEVPYAASRPRDPMVAPDGKVWFVGQRGNYVAVLDPESGDFRQYELDDGVYPHNLIVASDGTVYYAGNRASHIGKLDPETGAIEKFMMPDERARDPHTLIFDSKGDIWFTVQGGNFVGRLSIGSGEVKLAEAPVVEGGPRGGGSSRPYGIVMDSRDRPWVALFNTNQIATVDPESFELSTITLPENALPRRLGITSDDIIWYGDWRRGMLGRLDTESGEVTEFPLPSGEEARPYGMAVDDSDRVWFVEVGPRPNKFTGFDPMSGRFFSQTMPESGGGTIRHMYFDPETNSIWFGADTNTIGVAKLPPRRRIVS